MAHNPKRREIEAQARYLRENLDDPARREAQRYRALRDAQKRIDTSHGLLTVNDYQMAGCLLSRDARGFGLAGSIQADDGAAWDVLYNPKTGARLLKRTH